MNVRSQYIKHLTFLPAMTQHVACHVLLPEKGLVTLGARQRLLPFVHKLYVSG